MSSLTQRIGAIGLAAIIVAVLTGCAAPGGGDSTPGDEAPAAEAPGAEELPAVDPAAGAVPEECAEAFPLAYEPADIAMIESLPADWPAPPGGATLCMTSETMDGSSETASYATESPIDDVFAHYEAQLSGYDVFRSDGAENGTGYATLDGTNGDIAFQVREADGGFILVFGSGDAAQ